MFYVIHISHEPRIILISVISQSPIFSELRRRHAQWMAEHPGWDGWIWILTWAFKSLPELALQKRRRALRRCEASDKTHRRVVGLSTKSGVGANEALLGRAAERGLRVHDPVRLEHSVKRTGATAPGPRRCSVALEKSSSSRWAPGTVQQSRN